MMIMDHRFGRTLVLLAIASVAIPAIAGATDSGSSPSELRFTSTSADKAAEAKALAAQAAELSRRAAELAAESQAEEAAASSPKRIKFISDSASWAEPGVAEVLISDSAAESAASPTPAIGWRSHHAASDSAIRFANSGAGTKPAALAAQAMINNNKAAPGSELKFSDLKAAAEGIAQKTAATLAAPKQLPPVAPREAVAPRESTIAKVQTPAAMSEVPTAKAEVRAAKTEPQTAKSEVQTAKAESAIAKTETESPSTKKPSAGSENSAPTHVDENVQLVVSKIADPQVRPADGEEPMPVPADPYPNGVMYGSGGNEPCECVDASCCPPRRPLFWTAGVEATFLNPDLNTGYGQFAAIEFAEEREDVVSTSQDDVDSIYLAPRIWVGVQGCLWGANLRYFHLRANEGSFDPMLGSNGEWDGPGCGIVDFGYDSCNALEAYTVDLEITRRVCLNDCWMQFSAGVRHAELQHDAGLFGAALADDSQIFGFAESHRSTRGTGIVLGWYGRRPIFPCSCIHWFYNAHWSALWGPTNTDAETGVMLAVTSTDPDAVGTAGSVNTASTHVSDNLFIGEIQLGLEWDYALRCLPANAFCRAAVEYQRWSGGQGYSAANSFAGVEIDSVPTTFADSTAVADSPELDLVGLAISTGLTW
jgi:hypothetical protein